MNRSGSYRCLPESLLSAASCQLRTASLAKATIAVVAHAIEVGILRTARPNGDRGDGMTAEFLPSRLPIIQAPMAGSQGVELCVSVSEAGGLGSLPTAMLSPMELRDQIAVIRARTHAPFNVNFFCHVIQGPIPKRRRDGLMSSRVTTPKPPWTRRLRNTGRAAHLSILRWRRSSRRRSPPLSVFISVCPTSRCSPGSSTRVQRSIRRRPRLRKRDGWKTTASTRSSPRALRLAAIAECF